MHSRLDRLRSSSPSSPSRRSSMPQMTSNNPKRHASEVPPVSRSAPKKRRLLSLNNAEDLRSSRGSQRAAATTHMSMIPRRSVPDRNGDDAGDDDAADELSMVQDLAALNSSSPMYDLTTQLQHKTPMTTTTITIPPSSSSAAPAAVGQKVAALGAYLVANPPRSAAAGTEAAEAASQVARLQKEYMAVEGKLQLARKRLSEQLTAYDVSGGLSATTTPASLRPSSSMPVSVHVDEDDAVASALAHITSLESRRTTLLARIHSAQAAELEAKQNRDGRSLAAQVDNARLYRRLVDLGPAGAASLIRTLLKAAGIPQLDAAEIELAERRTQIRQELEDDLAREGLLSSSNQTPTDTLLLGHGQSGH